MTDVVYRGYGGYNGTRVTVQEGSGSEEPLRHVVRHSPTGFSWGYGGSGPADLARSLLIDFFGRTAPERLDRADPFLAGPGDEAIRLPVSYQDFKFDVVAKLAAWGPDQTPKYANAQIPEWELTGEQIQAWVDSR